MIISVLDHRIDVVASGTTIAVTVSEYHRTLRTGFKSPAATAHALCKVMTRKDVLEALIEHTIALPQAAQERHWRCRENTLARSC